MKKIIVVIMILLFLYSCDEDRFIAAQSNSEWTQTTDLSSGAGTLEVVYSIQNTGKETIRGYSIVFDIIGGGGTSSYETGNNQYIPIPRGKPVVLPAGNINSPPDCAILPGEILVDIASFSLAEGVVIQDVQIGKLHIWSEYKERIYEY